MALGQNTKRYETPNHPFQGGRITEEHSLVDRYGLKNKEELWRAQSQLRSFRREARKLLGEAQGDADVAAEQGADFLARLRRYGILAEDDSLDDILSLDVTDVLERRFQTIVYRNGFAHTPKQARQFITHGHIVLADSRVRSPSMLVEVDKENAIAFDERSPFDDDLHPERTEGVQ